MLCGIELESFDMAQLNRVRGGGLWTKYRRRRRQRGWILPKIANRGNGGENCDEIASLRRGVVPINEKLKTQARMTGSPIR